MAKKDFGLSLPYEVKYWEHKKGTRKAGYCRSGDIVQWKDHYWFVQKVSPECSVVRLYLKNLKTGETYRNWHDWEQPMFRVIGFAANETMALALTRYLQYVKGEKRK